ncbi:hypothetical protein B0H11DRAFT_1908532 [Mycena galericulata]|nr:hypothetical protein B0H11DRAFT_1908532 [Mycena galericulata]
MTVYETMIIYTSATTPSQALPHLASPLQARWQTRTQRTPQNSRCAYMAGSCALTHRVDTVGRGEGGGEGLGYKVGANGRAVGGREKREEMHYQNGRLDTCRGRSAGGTLYTPGNASVFSFTTSQDRKVLVDYARAYLSTPRDTGDEKGSAREQENVALKARGKSVFLKQIVSRQNRHMSKQTYHTIEKKATLPSYKVVRGERCTERRFEMYTNTLQNTEQVKSKTPIQDQVVLLK